MRDAVEIVVPARLGVGSAGCWRRRGSATSATASRSPPVRCWWRRSDDDPFLVASAALLQWLPWLLFGLFAGALSDRLDRRRLVVTVDLLRAAILAGIAASIVTDTVSIGRRAGRAVRARHGRDVRRQRLADAAADARPRATTSRSPTPASRPGSSPSTSWPARRSARRCSPSAWRCRSSARRSSSRRARVLVSRIALPPHGREPSERARTSGTRSPRASAGCGTTPRCARWC